MDISFIIVNYNTKGLLKYCLKGITQARIQSSYEVIVVDNASADGSAHMIRESFPWVTLIEAPYNLGFAAGNNLGMKVSQGNYILIMNPDIVVVEGSIERMKNHLEHNPDIGILGPQLLNPDKTIQCSCARFHTPLTPVYRRTFLGHTQRGKRELARFLMHDSHHKDIMEVDWLLGACLMIPRSALRKAGMFDERFFLYFEDTDLCRRFASHGFKVVYFPRAVMVHFHRRASAEDRGLRSLFAPLTRIHIMSGIRYFWKYRKNIIPPRP